MTAWEVSLILFPLFITLIVLRVPVAFALGLACVPVFLLEDRLTPFLLMNEMFKSYNAFVLLAVPFFLLAANIMNSVIGLEHLVALIFVVWGWPLVQFGLLQESEMAEMPMVLIYAAWPVAGITWMLFLAERLVDNIKLYRSEAP